MRLQPINRRVTRIAYISQNKYRVTLTQTTFTEQNQQRFTRPGVIGGTAMLRSRVLRLLSLPILAIGMALGSESALADMPVTVTAPVEGFVDNPCPPIPETVLTTDGTMQFTLHITLTPSGNLHLDSMDTTTNWTGMGMVTFAPYRISQTDHNILNTDPASVTTFRMDLREVTSGPAANFTLKAFGHVTFPPGSVTPTANIDRFEPSCS